MGHEICLSIHFPICFGQGVVFPAPASGDFFLRLDKQVESHCSPLCCVYFGSGIFVGGQPHKSTNIMQRNKSNHYNPIWWQSCRREKGLLLLFFPEILLLLLFSIFFIFCCCTTAISKEVEQCAVNVGCVIEKSLLQQQLKQRIFTHPHDWTITRPVAVVEFFPPVPWVLYPFWNPPKGLKCLLVHFL